MQNFGKIKNAYNDILVEGMYKKDVSKKSKFQEYIKAIKESKILKTQYQVYRNIEKKVESDEYKATQYVKENIELLSKFSKKEIMEANAKLAQAVMFEQDGEVDYNHKELHEEITKLIFTNKNASNIDSIIESTDKIVNFIKSNKTPETIKEDLIPTSILSNIAIEKYNEEYENLSESDKEVVRTLLEGDSEKINESITNIIRECIDLVDEQLEDSDLETKDKLLRTKDKLMRMKPTNESFIGDISKLIDLRDSLSDTE